MTPTEIKTKTPNWQAESLRLTAFLAPLAELKSEGWWASTIGSEPESRTAKPSRGELVEAGTYLDNTLTLSVQPGRIDWVLAPSQAQFENFEVMLKTVGQFPGVADAFARAMYVWLKNCPAIVRLAYGAVLLEHVESREAGYRLLSKYLPSVKIDESSQDFFYQINRPKPLPNAKDNLIINRLTKWSVMAGLPVRMAFSLGSPPTIGSATIFTPPDSMVHACRLELDVSTPGNRQSEITHDELPTIFRQLVQFGSEIAGRGDIP